MEGNLTPCPSLAASTQPDTPPASHGTDQGVDHFVGCLEKHLDSTQMTCVRTALERQRRSLTADFAHFQEQVRQAMQRTQLLQADMSSLSELAVRTADQSAWVEIARTTLDREREEWRLKEAELNATFEEQKSALQREMIEQQGKEKLLREEIRLLRERLSSERAELEAQLFSSQDEARELKFHVKDIEVQLATKESELEIAVGKLQSAQLGLQQETAVLHEQIITLKVQLQDAHELYTTTKSQYDRSILESRDAVESLRVSQKSWSSLKASLEAQVQRLESEKALLSSTSEEAQTRALRTAEEKCVALANRAQAAEAEIANMRNEMETVRCELEAKDSDVERLTRVVELLSLKNRSLEEGKGVYKRRQSASDEIILPQRSLSIEEVVRQSSSIDNTAEALLRKEEELQQVKIEWAETVEALSEKDQTLMESEEALNRAMQRLSETNENLRNTRITLHEKSNRVTTLEEENRCLSASLGSANEQLNGLRDELHTVQHKLEERDHKISDLESILEETKQKVTELESNDQVAVLKKELEKNQQAEKEKLEKFEIAKIESIAQLQKDFSAERIKIYNQIETLESKLQESQNETAYAYRELNKVREAVQLDFTSALANLASNCNSVTERGIYESFIIPDNLSVDEQLQRTKRTIINLHSKLLQERQCVESVRRRYAEKEKEVTDLQAQLRKVEAEWKTEYECYLESLNKVSRRAENAENILRTAESRAQQLQATVKTLNTKLEKLERDQGSTSLAEDSICRLDRLLSEKKHLEDKVRLLKKDLEQAQAEKVAWLELQANEAASVAAINEAFLPISSRQRLVGAGLLVFAFFMAFGWSLGATAC